MKKKAGIFLAAACGLLALAVVAVAAANQARVAEQYQAAERERLASEGGAAADNFGGRTPRETLELLAGAVVVQDAAAADYAVPALRGSLRERFAELTPAERVAVASELRAVAAAAGDPEESSVVFTEPVYVELVRYPSGAWKVASF